MNIKFIGATSVSTALTTIMTCIMFPLPKPLGYVNLGEVAIFIFSLLMGPLIGAFAGGVGSMLADIILGYSSYAPATFMIKGFEGFIVGYLRRLNEIAAMIVGSVSMILGYFLYDYILYGFVAWMDLLCFIASAIRIVISYASVRALRAQFKTKYLDEVWLKR